MKRVTDLQRLYGAIRKLEGALGPSMTLSAITPKNVAARGVYFFCEPGETRSQTGEGARIVRVGTHGLKIGASSTLAGRLRQHRGKRDGGGNHRGSIFRLLTGDALIRSGEMDACHSWGSSGVAATSSNRSQAEKAAEVILEKAVSVRLATMNVVCLEVPDEPGPDSLRGWIERNAIALLSNFEKLPIDPPSASWLGHHSSRPRVRASGLWNQNHVDEEYDRDFLSDLEKLADAQIARCG